MNQGGNPEVVLEGILNWMIIKTAYQNLWDAIIAALKVFYHFKSGPP